MPRIFIKGGVWKNTEDEILKAAVMKYGKNQWARISSLLVRKTPKQCKARWYEWLDPSIKKTEWSKDEEEKLLHLAKIMPCQWRSIAPILKRTPAQCLEHYERLLDKAQGRTEEYNADDDPRRLRPGEIDPTPETKPARPDPVDMDEDEKEMLAEARARLANTKGKKAKRKAREKQLEEARRLASLQKRREMKAAGIELRTRKRKYGIDYNREIPFEKRVPIGFYDVSGENNRPETGRLTNVMLSKLEGKTPSQVEAEQRRKDIKAAQEKGDAAPPAVAAMNRLSTLEQARKRTKMSLPEPQVGDKELEEIVKLGYAGENAKAVVADDDVNAPSRTLLANYNVATPASGALRTPRTPASQDTVMREAQNLVTLTTSETPLKGGENTPLHPSSFEGIQPKKQAIQTPNSIMQLGTPGRPNNISATPYRGSASSVPGTPLRTPLRDELAINPSDDTESMMGGSTPGSVRSSSQASIRQQLRSQLASLPKPRNEFEIVLPDLPADQDAADEEDEEDGAEDGAEATAPHVEDAADVEARRQAQARRRAEEEFRSRSLVLQRNLPRPTTVNIAALEAAPAKQSPFEALIQAEMLAMLRHDAAVFPPKGSANAPSKGPAYERLSRDELSEADGLVAAEMKALAVDVDAGTFANLWSAAASDFIFIPAEQKYGRASAAAKADKLASLKNELEITRSHVSQEAARASKLEKQLGVKLGGYQKRSQDLTRQFAATTTQLDHARVELASFEELAQIERDGLAERLAQLEQEVGKQVARETDLQRRYADLLIDRRQLFGGVQQ